MLVIVRVSQTRETQAPHLYNIVLPEGSDPVVFSGWKSFGNICPSSDKTCTNPMIVACHQSASSEAVGDEAAKEVPNSGCVATLGLFFLVGDIMFRSPREARVPSPHASPIPCLEYFLSDQKGRRPASYKPKRIGARSRQHRSSPDA